MKHKKTKAPKKEMPKAPKKPKTPKPGSNNPAARKGALGASSGY